MRAIVERRPGTSVYTIERYKKVFVVQRVEMYGRYIAVVFFFSRGWGEAIDCCVAGGMRVGATGTPALSQSAPSSSERRFPTFGMRLLPLHKVNL